MQTKHILLYYHAAEGPRSVAKIEDDVPGEYHLEVKPSMHRPGELWVRFSCKEIWITPAELAHLGAALLAAANNNNG